LQRLYMRKKLHFLVVLIIVFLCAYATGYFIAQPKTKMFISSYGRVRWPLYLEVSPLGYPVPGESWKIYVYETDATSGKITLQPAANSVVVVNVRIGNYGQIYNISANAEGQAFFQFLPQYSDVAFQAFKGELKSDIITITAHYISPETINYLSTTNVLMSSLAAIGSLAIRKKKVRQLFRYGIFSTLCLFAVVSILSLVSRFSQPLTTWGYPDSIFGQIITYTSLVYLTIVGVILFSIFTVWAFISESPNESKAKSL
jgi:hypothetical protein